MSRPGVAEPRLLGAGDAAELTARLWAAARTGTPVAVLDPSWPATLRARAETELAAAELAAGELVLFTSGSSGRPRGVVRTAASWLASVEPLTEITGIGPDDLVWLPASPSSSLTLYGGWHATAVGAHVRGAEGWPRSAPPSAVTALHASPRVLSAVLGTAESGLLPAVRVAVVAGGMLPAGLRERAANLGWRLVEYYGAAELSFVAWRPNSLAYQRFPGVDVEVRDGEVWARSAYLCERYLAPDDDGPLRRDGAWASVGDLARLDNDGGLEVLGRGDAAVTTGGRTVVVEEVEAVIRDSPVTPGAVRDVVGSSIPHPLLGELLVAVVAVDPAGPPPSRAQLEATCTDLPDWSRPRRWWLAAELPLTTAGKPDRAAVRSGVRDGSLTDRPLR